MFHIIFSGSGVLFPTHLGGVQYLMDRWDPNNDSWRQAMWNNVAYHGVSGGSLVAAVLASGMTPLEAKDLSKQFLPKNVVSWNKRFWQPADCMGLFTLDKMEKVLSKYVAKNFTETKHHLRIVAVDVNTRKTVYFDGASSPDMPVVKAVIASSAVPLLFTPVKYKGMLLQDGGVADNLPTSFILPKDVSIAFRIGGLPPKQIKTRIQYITATIQSSLYSSIGFTDHVIDLNPPFEAFDIFGIDEKKVDEMFEIGYNTTKNYFEK